MFDCDNKQCPYHSDNNVALSWDELKTMEGKPVWIEEYDPIDDEHGWHRAYWCLLQGFDMDLLYISNISDSVMEFDKSEMGKTWQAYRKERK